MHALFLIIGQTNRLRERPKLREYQGAGAGPTRQDLRMVVMKTSFLKLSIATLTGVLLLTACASSEEVKPAASATACPSKWVAAGNNGAKADRYYKPDCQ